MLLVATGCLWTSSFLATEVGIGTIVVVLRSRFVAAFTRSVVSLTDSAVTETVSTTFTFTQAEYVLAMKRYYRSTLNVGRDVIGGLLAIAGGFYLLANSYSPALGWLLVVLGVVLLAMVGYAMFLLPKLIYKSQPKLKDEYSSDFSEDGIRFRTHGIDAQLRWSLYKSWLFDDEFYIMYHGKRELSVIPRRILSGDDDQRLRELLQQNIGPPRA